MLQRHIFFYMLTSIVVTNEPLIKDLYGRRILYLLKRERERQTVRERDRERERETEKETDRDRDRDR